jgi:ABC-type nitrate/sulfonate/bicarbonate transport system substrate-binding protein
MRHRKFQFALTIIFAACLLPQELAAQPKKLRLAFSALAYANPPFWIAQDLRLFHKYGLDGELVYVGGAWPIQAMLGGSVDVSQVGGAAAVAAAAQGAEIAILGAVFSRLTFAIHASPQIKHIGDLKGKVLAAGAAGGNSYFAGLIFLSKFGWTPNKDVGIVAAGGSPSISPQHDQYSDRTGDGGQSRSFQSRSRLGHRAGRVHAGRNGKRARAFDPAGPEALLAAFAVSARTEDPDQRR